MVMAKVDVFLEALINYDKENIHPDVIKAIQPYLKDSEFEPGNLIRTLLRESNHGLFLIQSYNSLRNFQSL